MSKLQSADINVLIGQYRLSADNQLISIIGASLITTYSKHGTL